MDGLRTVGWLSRFLGIYAFSMAVARSAVVSLDCADPLALGEFWAAMLGGEIMFTSTMTVLIRTDWVWLSALRVSDYVAPTWPGGDVPKQIHLDLAVTELEAAVAEAERLGARTAPVQPAPDRWRVLLDPAGHPFCLTTQIPPEAR
jgi:hypothetical protein